MPNTKRCLSFGGASTGSSSFTASATSSKARRNLFFVMPAESFAGESPDSGSLTPTSLQQTLCLNATSDVDVCLTDEEMSSNPGSIWLPSRRSLAVGSGLPVAPACSRKQSITVPAFAGPPVFGASGDIGTRRATLSAVGGGACVCSAAVVSLFSASQLRGSLQAAPVGIEGSKTTTTSPLVGGVALAEPTKYSLGDPDVNFDRISNINFSSKKTPITDEYRITHEIIGVGESGRVMACFSRTDNKKYALKVLRDGPRSRREVHLHYFTSQNENIVSIIDIFENTFEGVKCLLIVVEFLEGGDLLTRFENQGRFPYSEEIVSRIIGQLASAVKSLHDMNIAHRDIKLENILCSSSNVQTCIYKLGDFGFAKRSDQNKLMESPCCTPTYVCPEILSHERYNKSCDMWAIGVVMYILLCGYPPFYSMKGLPFSPGMRERITVGLYAFPPDDWDHISEEAKNVIRNLLRTDPATRATVDEVLASEFVQRYVDNRCRTDGGLRTIWSDTSLSSLEDFFSAASDTPPALDAVEDSRSMLVTGTGDESSTDSAMGYSSGECGATTTDDDSEGPVIAFKFPPRSRVGCSLKARSECNGGSNLNDEKASGWLPTARFLLGWRSCREPTNRFGSRLPPSITSRPSLAGRSKVNVTARPRIPRNIMSARCLDTAGERRICANAAALAARPARLCSIQEEVNRALNMMRLGADDLMLVLPQKAVGNSLLERRRSSRATTAAN